MLLVQKRPIFSLLVVGQTRLEIILNAFAEKKETFFDYNNKKFFEVPKIAFSKGLTHALVKKCHFFVYVDLEKFGLEIMLNDFAQEKETFLTLKNRIFQSPKNCIYPKRLTQGFDEKVPIFLL